MSDIVIDVVAQSDIGLVRKRNEDVFLVADLTARAQHTAQSPLALPLGENGLVFSVFDGMGGEHAGDKASRLAADTFFAGLTRRSAGTGHELAQSMIESLRAANAHVHQVGKSDPELSGMGTTLTAAGLVDDNLILAHVGDSRAYLLRSGAFVQVTEDQSLANDLVARGVISAADAAKFQGKNVILQALGVTPDLTPFTGAVQLQRGDLLLLCTDGLTNMVPKEDILEVLTSQGQDLGGAAATLITLARAHGGLDNITLVLVRFRGDGLIDPRAIQVKKISPDDEPAAKRKGMSPLRVALLTILVLLTIANALIFFYKG
jgi:PPM family protein phosphatase